MLWTEIKTNWKTLAPKFKTKWTKITDKEITDINGKRDELVNCIVKHYKGEKVKVEKEVDDFIKTLVMKAKT